MDEPKVTFEQVLQAWAKLRTEARKPGPCIVCGCRTRAWKSMCMVPGKGIGRCCGACLRASRPHQQMTEHMREIERARAAGAEL